MYDTWAAAQNGPLTRRGVSFPTTDAELLGDFDGITVAEDAMAAWSVTRPGTGVSTTTNAAPLEVSDLLAVSADGYRALLRTLGSFSSVAPRTKIDTSGDDIVRQFLPGRDWETVSSDPYMSRSSTYRVPSRAARTRGSCRRGSASGSPKSARTDATDHAGAYRWEVAEGVGTCVAEDHTDDRTFHPRGLALLYAGVQSCANLRWAGLLTGGRPEQDTVWDTLFGGRQFHIRDYY